MSEQGRDSLLHLGGGDDGLQMDFVAGVDGAENLGVVVGGEA